MATEQFSADQATARPDTRPARAEPAPPPQAGVVIAGLLGTLVLGGIIWSRSGGLTATLFAVGTAFGFVLFHSRFGFTSAWRQLVAVRQGAGLRAHMLMIAVAATLFAPILATGASFGAGTTPTASLAPIGFGVVIGAFLFGIGMQVGGACASGTLFAVGSGQSAIVLTLGGFVVGSVLGAWTFDFWLGLPAFGPVSLADTGAGYLGGWLITLAAIGAVVAVTYVVGRGRRVPPTGRPASARGAARAVRGSWPLWVGALLLAGLNGLTLWLSGSAWGITSAFALWGSKLLDLVGVDVTSWSYWADRAGSYEAGVLGDTTSVMDIGIMLGALVASAAAGAWTLHRRIPGKLALGAVLGGIAMGYGARIAYGCNIGAYFAGIASFSLHGWLWGAMALLGTYLGLKLRPVFGLGNPKPEDSVC